MFEKIRNTALLLMFPAVLVGMYGFCFKGWDTFPILFRSSMCVSHRGMRLT